MSVQTNFRAQDFVRTASSGVVEAPESAPDAQAPAEDATDDASVSLDASEVLEDTPEPEPEPELPFQDVTDAPADETPGRRWRARKKD